MRSRTLLKLFLLFFISSVIFVCGKKLTDKELIELAQKEYGRGNHEKAVSYYEEIVRIHPDSELCSTALFMIGYVNANELKDYEKANKVYSEFLEKYPENELVSSVNFELENMGKSPEQLVP